MKRVSQKTKSINYYHSLSKLVFITFFGITTFSCSNDDGEKPPIIADEISQEIKDLIYFRGEEKAETVMILIPGGPSTEFATDFVDDFASAFTGKGILTASY